MLSDISVLPAVQLGDFLLQFELDEPRESVREIARRELRETPEIVKPAVQELRRLLEGNFQSHLRYHHANSLGFLSSLLANSVMIYVGDFAYLKGG